MTKKKREVNAELQKLQDKERKAKWYQQRKASNSSASNITSDESDFPLSSPRPSQISEVMSNASEPDSDGEQPVFPSGLPVENQ